MTPFPALFAGRPLAEKGELGFVGEGADHLLSRVLHYSFRGLNHGLREARSRAQQDLLHESVSAIHHGGPPLQGHPYEGPAIRGLPLRQ